MIHTKRLYLVRIETHPLPNFLSMTGLRLLTHKTGFNLAIKWIY
ncbi:hypothetical protein [Legionella longbeachae]|nr:hypothetical protein [Legionella longbeachae]VEE03153.1 Uncharacterised protein [Legionella oakridgensis]